MAEWIGATPAATTSVAGKASDALKMRVAGMAEIPGDRVECDTAEMLSSAPVAQMAGTRFGNPAKDLRPAGRLRKMPCASGATRPRAENAKNPKNRKPLKDKPDSCRWRQ